MLQKMKKNHRNIARKVDLPTIVLPLWWEKRQREERRGKGDLEFLCPFKLPRYTIFEIAHILLIKNKFVNKFWFFFEKFGN